MLKNNLIFEKLQHIQTVLSRIFVMITIEDIRVCKSCGNLFSKKAGVTIILECPQCKGTSLDHVSIDYEKADNDM